VSMSEPWDARGRKIHVVRARARGRPKPRMSDTVRGTTEWIAPFEGLDDLALFLRLARSSLALALG